MAFGFPPLDLRRVPFQSGRSEAAINRPATLLLSILFLLSASPSLAGTFIVPPDDLLIDRADEIATGIIVSKFSARSSQGAAETVYRLAVIESLAGPETDLIEFREWGGALDGRIYMGSGTPVYEVGEKYLVFFRSSNQRRSTLQGLLGQFRFTGELLLRDEARIHGWRTDGSVFEAVPRRRSFLDEIRTKVSSRHESSRSSIRSNLSGPVRPRANDMDHMAAATAAGAAWRPGSIVRYSVSSTPATGSSVDLNDNEERIIVDDPEMQIEGTFDGTGPLAEARYVIGGSSLSSHQLSIHQADIIIQDGLSSSNIGQARYVSIIAHEMGHTLGFRHSDEDCGCGVAPTTDSIMTTLVTIPNAELTAWDRLALDNYLTLLALDPDYLITAGSPALPVKRDRPVADWRIFVPAAPACSEISIDSHPANRIVATGSPVILTVEAMGTEPITYRWYEGESGDESTPLNVASLPQITVTPGSTTNYWVRVSNECPSSADSNTVTVSVGNRQRGIRRR